MQRPSLIKTFKYTLKNEGVWGFYKGAVSNMYVASATFSLLFAAKELSDRVMKE